MPNTHLIADTMAEIMAREEDLLPACVISTTWPTVPVSSMTLAAFTTQAYVRDGQHLVYADQPAITLTLSGSAGTYWLAIAREVSTAYATWTRRAGSHYMFQLAGARPPDVDGLLVFSSVTVSGGVITAVTPAPGVTLAEAWRARAGLGTMSVQNASAVAVTGGTATGLTSLAVNGPVGIGTAPDPLRSLTVQFDTQFNGNVGIAAAPTMRLHVNGSTRVDGSFGISIAPDAGFSIKLAIDAAGKPNGGSWTNTTSFLALKEALTALPGALATLRRLRPRTWQWRDPAQHTGHPVGFVVEELLEDLPAWVAMGPDGPVGVQEVGAVAYLVAAVQDLAQQVETLAARLDAAGA